MHPSSFITKLESGEIFVSDGAAGTNLQARGLAHGVSAEAWVLENPDEIIRLHRDFIDAGADIILTSTFGGSPVRLERAGLAGKAEEINRRAVELARKAVEGTSGLIAGSMGPTGEMLKPLGTLEVEDAFKAFAVQAKAITDAGADLLLLETHFDLVEAATAVKAARSVSSLPLVCSFSFDRGTRSMMGVSPAGFAKEIGALDVDILGVNCGRSLEENYEALNELRQNTDKPIWFKPNAGLPRRDSDGNTVYDHSPLDMGRLAPEWIEAGAQILGGCCGSTSAHLNEIAKSAARHR